MGGDTGVDVGKAATNVALGPMAQVIGAKLYPLLNRKSVVDAFGNLSPEASTALSKIGVDPSLLTPQGIARLEEWFKADGRVIYGRRQVGDDSSQCGACGTGRHPPHAGRYPETLRQIAREEAMRNYARGKGAGDTFKDFDALQAQDVQGAISRRQAELGAIGGKQQTPRLGNQRSGRSIPGECAQRLNARCPTRSATGYGEAGRLWVVVQGRCHSAAAQASIRSGGGNGGHVERDDAVYVARSGDHR